MSISSAKLIQRRTLEFCKTINNWQPTGELFEKNIGVNYQFRRES